MKKRRKRTTETKSLNWKMCCLLLWNCKLSLTVMDDRVTSRSGLHVVLPYLICGLLGVQVRSDLVGNFCRRCQGTPLKLWYCVASQTRLKMVNYKELLTLGLKVDGLNRGTTAGTGMETPPHPPKNQLLLHHQLDTAQSGHLNAMEGVPIQY